MSRHAIELSTLTTLLHYSPSFGNQKLVEQYSRQNEAIPEIQRKEKGKGDGYPDRGDPSWVMLEFDMPAEAQAAKIEIKDPTDLINAAGSSETSASRMGNREDIPPDIPGAKDASRCYGWHLVALLPKTISAEESQRAYGFAVSMTFTIVTQGGS